MLLEQVFPEGRTQKISSVISQKGSARAGEFSRCDEFIFFVMFGTASPLPLNDDMLHETVTSEGDEVEWGRLKRNGANGKRERSASLFYPIFLKLDGTFHSTGEPLQKNISRDAITPPPGTVAVFPVLTGGQEMSWGLSREKLEAYVPKGFVKFGSLQMDKHQKAMIYYLTSGYVEAAEAGDITLVGSVENPRWVHNQNKGMRPMTVWAKVSHDAGWHGSRLLEKFIPGQKFPFPKSLFAVEDSLRFFVYEKPNAVILDFFSGSGTTAHAVMRLNRQDGGRRQCISVTNNEVAADEQKALREQGLRPGDAEWEKHGICDYITKPRVAAAITGKTPSGEPIKGEYKFTDEFPMAEGFEANAEFFTLTYEARNAVNHNLAFARIAPLLWLRAGSQGKRIDKLPVNGWALADTYGLLTEVDQATPFIRAVEKAPSLRMAYIVTDDDRRFQAIAKRLPNKVEPVRLYESYLTNFSFANGE
ncbi:MAG: DNA methyltransferase [Burkholderiales bacterium]